jgi:hypothetical protein
MFSQLKPALLLIVTLALPAIAQDSQSHHFDVSTNSGSLHLGDDADARKVGLPLYPGARVKVPADDSDKSQANLSMFTEAFGFKLVVANYESDDAPAKVLDFYRDKLKKYGRVLECHSHKHGVDVHDDKDSDGDKDSKASKEVKCDEDSGPVTELKVGTEDNQRVVAVEPRDSGSGSTFALVYVHTRGKRGEI